MNNFCNFSIICIGAALIFIASSITAAPAPSSQDFQPSQSFKNLSLSLHVLQKLLESIKSNNYTAVCRIGKEGIHIITENNGVAMEIAKQNVKDICKWVSQLHMLNH
jgi:hypothetical protein